MTVHFQIDSDIFADYINTINPVNETLKRIQDYNNRHPKGGMMIDPVQMRVMCWLANLINTKYYLEIGVFTGYSSTAMALNLPDDAQLHLCDVSVTYTDIAKEFWIAAGVLDKIKLYLQPALISLRELLQQGKQGFFDFILIDADKSFTREYMENVYPLLRSGGIIAIDNTYQKGKVVEPEHVQDSLSLQVMRKFNQDIMQDSRFSTVMLPLGDGLTLLMKK